MSKDRYSARGDYKGPVAEKYIGKREVTAQWRREQQLVERILEDLPAASSILDVPLGTARFLPAYVSGGHRLYGLDVSRDMFTAARRAHAGLEGELRRFVLGDAEFIPLRRDSVDCVVSTRFTSWLPLGVLRRVAAEFGRVARREIIVQVDTVRRAGVLGLVGAFISELPVRPVSTIRALLGSLRKALGGTPRTTTSTPDSENYFYHSPEDFQQAFRDAGFAVRSVHRVRGIVDYCDCEIRELRIYRLSRPSPEGTEDSPAEPAGWQQSTRTALGAASVVELAGLPGIGKTTTLSRLIGERLSAENTCVTARWADRLGRLRLHWVFLLVGAFRFRQPLEILLSDGTGKAKPPGLARQIASTFAMGRRQRRGPEFGKLQFLSAFSMRIAEYHLALLEAWLWKRSVLLDEGLVQLGSALWLCAPPAVRASFWESWLASLPRSTTAIVVHGEPSVALERAAARPQGLPWILEAATQIHGAPEDPLRAFMAFDDLFRGSALRSRVRCIEVDTPGETARTARVIADALDTLTGDASRAVVFSRPRKPFPRNPRIAEPT